MRTITIHAPAPLSPTFSPFFAPLLPPPSFHHHHVFVACTRHTHAHTHTTQTVVPPRTNTTATPSTTEHPLAAATMSNLALCALAVFSSLFVFQAWLCDQEDDDMFTPFFVFSVVVIPLLFYVAVSRTLSLHNLAPEAAARERQSAAALEALKRDLAGSVRLKEAAFAKEIKWHQAESKVNQDRISQCQKDFSALGDTSAIKSRVIGDLELKLKYTTQCLSDDRAVATTGVASADKKALEATVASLQKAQEELAVLKSARDSAVVPVVPFVTAAADLAAHTIVCEHQGLLAEKTKVDGLLVAEKRESHRKDLTLAAQGKFSAEKDRQLAKKEAALVEKDEELKKLKEAFCGELKERKDQMDRDWEVQEGEWKAQVEGKYAAAVAAMSEKIKAELKQQYDAEVAAEVSEREKAAKMAHDATVATQAAAEVSKQMESANATIKQLKEQQTSHQSAGSQVEKLKADHLNEIARLQAKHAVAKQKWDEDIGAMDADHNEAESKLVLERKKYEDLEKRCEKLAVLAKEKEAEAKRKDTELTFALAAHAPNFSDPKLYDTSKQARDLAAGLSPAYNRTLLQQGTPSGVPVATNFAFTPPPVPVQRTRPSGVASPLFPQFFKRGPLSEDSEDDYESDEDEDDESDVEDTGEEPLVLSDEEDSELVDQVQREG